MTARQGSCIVGRDVVLVRPYRPSDATVRAWLAQVAAGPRTFTGPLPERAPEGFVLDVERVDLGAGAATFEAARRALVTWRIARLGWVEAVPTDAPPHAGLVVAMLVRVLGVWIANADVVEETIDEERAAGFRYTTLAAHAECGTECFLVTWDRSSDRVVYEIRAVSRPGRWWVAAARPLVRRMQKRFARDSLRAMRRAVDEGRSARPQ